MVAYAERRGREMSKTRWRVALSIMTAVSTFSPKGSLRSRPALTIPSTLSLNALNHLRQTLRHRHYYPGTATGTGINIPVSVCLFRRALREEKLPAGALVAASGLAIFGAMLPLSHEIGERVAKLLDDNK